MNDFFMRHWKTVAAILGAILVGALVYGEMQSMYQADQRAATAAIASVENGLSKSPQEYMVMRAMTGMQDADKTELKAAADALMGQAEASSDTASIEAYLKAAEWYRLIDDEANQRAAFEKAAETATGALRYAAVAGLANLDLETENNDSAISRFNQLASEDSYFGRQATIDLINTYDALGQNDAALAACDTFLKRWPNAAEAVSVQELRKRAESKAG